MTRGRLIGYLIAGLFFFAFFGLGAFLFFPSFREGGDVLVGVVLTQIVAAIIGLGTKEIVEAEIKKQANGEDE